MDKGGGETEMGSESLKVAYLTELSQGSNPGLPVTKIHVRATVCCTQKN